MHCPQRRSLLPRVFSLLLFLAILAPAPPVLAGPLNLRGSDSEGLILEFHWDLPTEVSGSEHPDLNLPGCCMDGISGAPMLPLYQRLIALPPGHRAQLSWSILETRPLPGRPLPFPTPRRQELPGGEVLYNEESIIDEDAYAIVSSISVSLGEPRALRDLSVVQLSIRPVVWHPETGLGLATEIEVRVRFVPDASARDMGETPRFPDRLWGGVYRNAVLNSGQAAAWRRRVPARSLLGDREGRAEALLVLKTGEDGLYGLPGDSLIARGVPAGTSLDEVALFRRRFTWVDEQPEFEDIPVARFWRDADGDGLLDAEDRVVFLGRRLRSEPDSPDPIEWYGNEGNTYLAVDPALVLEMGTREGWVEGGGWTTPTDFQRRFWRQGEVDFFVSPPATLYDLDPVSREWDWVDNLYYWNKYNAIDITLDIPSPAYVPGTEAELQMLFQGYTASESYRTYTLDMENSDGIETSLPGMQLKANRDSLYAHPLPPGTLADGTGQLYIDRSDDTIFWSMVKWYDLSYRSHYRVRGDSLYFNSDGLNGDLEMVVGGLSREWDHWILVDSSGDDPLHVTLGPENQSGGSGDWQLRFRDQATAERRWWLADEDVLRLPRIQPAADLSFLSDPGPYDILAIVHEDFLDPIIDRWQPYRESQGYRVKVLAVQQVWDGFFHGARGAYGLRNAARFAYQQWGAEALLLVGDACKDAREINSNAGTDFMPVYNRHEDVEGDNEIVALDEWAVRFSYGAWQSMLMGRIPAGSVEELEIFLDKLECFESSAPGENCLGDGPWRKRILYVSDDHWSYGFGQDAFEHPNELNFEIGQRAAIERMDSCVVNDPDWGFPGDIHGEPYFESVKTVPWYADHPGADGGMIGDLLRPIMWPHFVDSLSVGWTHVHIQAHANRNMLTHELIFKTGDASDSGDHDYLENVGMPFIWSVLGCHANNFCASNERFRKDCMGEKMLFLDRNRGAVASWASDGYEYLGANVTLGRHLATLMFYRQDWDQDETVIFPEWVLGGILTATELRWIPNYYNSYRFNLLGDPLTRVDMGPPRVRLFMGQSIDEELVWYEQTADSFISVQSPDDTLEVLAYFTDEEYIHTLRLSDSAHGDLAFEAEALIDSVAADSLGWSRAWRMRARVPFDFDMEALVLSATDLSGREGGFTLPVAKLVRFYTADGDSLSEGQYVQAGDELRIRVQVPHPGLLPSQFHLIADSLDTGQRAFGSEDPLVHEIIYDYEWEPGLHRLEVLLDGVESFGEISLVVDREPELLDWVIFPNPFRDSVFFRYRPSGEILGGEVKIFTVSGRMIRRLPLEALAAGEQHWLEWDGMDRSGDPVANGTYLMKIRAEVAGGRELLFHDRVVRMR